MYFIHQHFLSKPCGLHVGSIWLWRKKRDVLSQNKHVGSVWYCHYWCLLWNMGAYAWNIIQPSFSSNSQWDSRRVEPKTFKSRTLDKHVSTVCGCCRTTLCVSDNLLRLSIYLQWINGHFRILDWRYLPYIRPIFQAYVREYPHKIWPNIWY